MDRFKRIVWRTVLWISGTVLALIILLFVLIRIPAVQQYVLKQVTAYLEKKIETPFRIGAIGLDLPKLLVLEDIYVEDRSRDTLLAGEKIRVDINLLRLFRNVVEIKRVDLVGVTAKIKRQLPEGDFNFQYIIDAFVDPDKAPDPADNSSPMVFDMDRINLERIRLLYQDDVLGLSTALDLRGLNTRIKTFDLEGDMHFGLSFINIEGLKGGLQQWIPDSTAATGGGSLAEGGGPANQDAGGSSRLPQLELGDITLKDIDFAYQNTDMGLDSRFAFNKLLAKLQELNLNESRVSIERIELDGSRSHVIFAKTTNSNPATAGQAPEQVESQPEDGGDGWKVAAGSIRIRDTDFAYRDDNQPHTPKGFDYGNIGITALRGDLTDLYYSSDSISGKLDGLSARDRSGFVINRLESRFVYTDQGARLDGLYAETPYTLIRDYIQVSYPSLSALTEHPGLIGLRADLDKSHLGMQDVQYFVPDLDTMQVMQPLLAQTFHVDGELNGRLGDLYIPVLRISTLDQTALKASARITGLPDMDKLDVQLDLQSLTTGKQDLDRLIAAGLIPDSIDIPRDIALQGTFNGGIQAFNTDLQLQTSEGNAKLKAAYQTKTGPDGSRDTLYDAILSISEVNLGRILKQDSLLGRFSLNASIQGQGLDPKKATASLKADLLGLEAMGYNYQGIQLSAEADQGHIMAKAGSADPNIDFDLDADLHLQGKYPKLDLSLMIDSVNLKNLGLIKDELRYHGKLTANLETADVDYLNGTVEVKNSSIAYNHERYTFDSIHLLATSSDSSNLLQLTSEFLNAHLVGNYRLSELSASIQDIVAVYYQPDSAAKVYTYSPQQFDFSARLTRSKFIREFLPELTEMQDITLDGSFNSDDKFLLAKAIAPRITYGGTSVTDIGLDITTFDSTMYYSALIRQIALPSVELTNTLLSGTVIHNQLDFGLWIKDQQEKERYHLGMGMKVDAGNFVLSLLEDGLMLNYDRWEIHPENKLSFGKDGVRAQHFVLNQNGQHMSAQSTDSAWNAPIDLVFENFRIETFSQMLESELLNMGGGINGKATLFRLESSPLFVSDINIKQFFFGKDTIGDILVKVNNERDNVYATQIDIMGKGNAVHLGGNFTALPNRSPELDFVLDLEPLTMRTLEAFSLGYFRQTQGNLNGKLAITGTTDAPKINGELLFSDAALNIGMLNATLQVDGQRVVFDNQGIRFNRFELRDRKNNLARLNGTVQTANYQDFNFNLTLTATDFEVLNSTKKDNDLFYGQLYVTPNIRITGSLNNPVVNGTLAVDENTQVTFIMPNDDPGMVERDGIIKFVNRSDTSRANVFARLDSLTTTELGGVQLSVNIRTHESAAFSIVIDEGSGDALNIKGSADLTAGIDPSGEITLTGTYTVEEGSYSFTFEPVKRLFNFKKGSTITWTGDPLDARLAITAVYKVKAPTLELVQNQLGGERLNLYKQRVPFDVNLGIKGQMFQPELAFSIDLDEDNALISQDVATKVNTALNQLQENESEMNKQVFALILMGRFMAANPFESMSGGGAESWARNSVSSLLSSQLNRLAGDLIKGVELDFDLQSGEDYTTGTMQSRTDLNIGFSKMLFDDRLKITIGSNFELEGNARPGEQTTNIAGDISVDYQLSKDGRYFLRAYRKNQYQVTLQGQFVETGLGFIINMDYNRFREIFMSTKELADMYSTDSRDFQRRFDRERMETDSIYRDSVRQIIRDSLERTDPEFRQRMQERRERQRNEQRQPSGAQVRAGEIPADLLNGSGRDTTATVIFTRQRDRKHVPAPTTK